MKRFMVCRRVGTRAGLRTEPLAIPAMGVDVLVMSGPDKAHVFKNLRAMGVGIVGVCLVELDSEDRPMAEMGAA